MNDSVVSFVYFDLGGVVILDFSGTDKWALLKKKIGINAEKDVEFEAFWNEYEPKVNAGLNIEKLIPMIEKQFGLKFPPDYSFLMDGFVKNFEVNKSIWPVLDKIHKRCKIGLLTNMYPHMFEGIKKRGLMPEIRWDIVIDSSVEGIPKPDSRIFKLAEQKAGFKGSEILFVDNSQENVDAAQALGWQTFFYDSSHPKEASNKLSALFSEVIK